MSISLPRLSGAAHAGRSHPRLGQQFHWENRGYETFEDFLASLNSRKRKAVRKERRAATADGIDIRALSGDEIETRQLGCFLPVLPRHFGTQMGLGLPQPGILSSACTRPWASGWC